MATAHGVAEVVGTRFSLSENRDQTTLAVQDGRVDLHQKDQRLEVRAGETAVADAAGMRKLAPADAWITELLARAEAGPWDVVNRGTGVYSNDVWRMDARGGPAERRIWNMISGGNDRHYMVIFRDGKRWARGVVVGRMMILAKGQSPAEVWDASTGSNISWRTYRVLGPGVAAGRKAGVCLNYGPAGDEAGCIRAFASGEKPDGTWFRYAVYFDTEVPGGLRSLMSGWYERDALPAASAWEPYIEKGIDNGQVEVGFVATGVLMEMQGFKFVPLGPDMPLPPKELLERK